MAKQEIRLEYSGFMIFAAKMISVATGLVFQFIVARALLPVSAGAKTEYDLWFNISDITTWFILMGGVVSFWTMRFVARGKEGSIKTGIVANFVISLIAASIFLLLVPLITSGLGISEKYLMIYFLISIQIIEMYSIVMLEACLQAKIPQAIGYGLIIQQVCKVLLGYFLIVRLNQLLLGAVVTTMAAFGLQSIYYLKLLAQELNQKIRWEYVKEWLKGSLVNIYNAVGNQIAALVFIMLFNYGGEGARGILGAATTVANVISYSSFLAYALTPKLLAERRHEDITTSLRMVLMFAIPMTVGAVALSDSYITILAGSEYVGAAPVLIVLALDFFVVVVSGLFGSVLFGVETVDAEARISLQELAKSRLFIAFSLPYLHSAITIPTAFFVLTNYALNQPLQAALYVSIINASARFVMFLIQYAIVRKMVKIAIPWRSIGKYVLAAALMGGVLLVVPHATMASLPLFEVVFMALFETAVGGAIYLGVLMAIDEKARKLPVAVIQEIKYKLKRN